MRSVDFMWPPLVGNSHPGRGDLGQDLIQIVIDNPAGGEKSVAYMMNMQIPQKVTPTTDLNEFERGLESLRELCDAKTSTPSCTPNDAMMLPLMDEVLRGAVDDFHV
jgi:hypothetical protein